MSGQADSPHYFRNGDRVRSIHGRTGTVVEAAALYALIEWSDGQRLEIDQFDPLVFVTERAERS